MNFILETLRMFPPVIDLMREASSDYKIPNSNLVIPKGVAVLIPNHAIQNDPEYFPEPEKFIPERFTEANKAKRHPMTHLPFGNFIFNFL